MIYIIFYESISREVSFYGINTFMMEIVDNKKEATLLGGFFFIIRCILYFT